MSHHLANPICRLAADPADREAWTAAVESYAGVCWRIALRMLGGPEAAADVVQDCMLAVRAAAPRFQAGDDPDGAAMAWVARVAVNTCHAHRRRQRQTAPLPADAIAVPSPAPSASEEALPHLRAAIAELPAALREAVSLRYLAGLDYAAVGVSLGIEPGTARVRVHRAVEALRSLMSRRGCAVTAVALVSVLDGVAEAAVPPLPVAAASSLAATPLPPVAGASLVAVGLAISVSLALVAGGVLLAWPATPPPAPAPPMISVTKDAAWIDLFPADDLSEWAAERGSWSVRDGIVNGLAPGNRGARLRSLADFGDGELTCRLRIRGGGPGMRGEIQVGNYSTFFTVLATGERWTTIHLQQRGSVRSCTSDGVALPAEAGETIAGPLPGPVAFYVTGGGVIEIADARYRTP